MERAPCFYYQSTAAFQAKETVVSCCFFVCFEINCLNGILNIDLTPDKLDLFLNKFFAATKKCWKKVIGKKYQKLHLMPIKFIFTSTVLNLTRAIFNILKIIHSRII